MAAVVVGDWPLAVGHEELARADAARNIRVRPGGAGMDGRRKEMFVRHAQYAYCIHDGRHGFDQEMQPKIKAKNSAILLLPTRPGHEGRLHGPGSRIPEGERGDLPRHRARRRLPDLLSLGKCL